ncbi:TonB-dependent receptor family protein [Rivibacter subsaxonicus]|uniref:Iron complex outermembrane receptor protein n=1 Tax=Rivibacter subsaxonicus TaxID=457575 RepID=A0A4Q7W0G4_9BURK|nr:TonB-dependent receptor [Rivibacter subsaxonicus]RZU02305.1 iron complex outermembrane receptor protein [Rivibacter subsaxonicus]
MHPSRLPARFTGPLRCAVSLLVGVGGGAHAQTAAATLEPVIVVGSGFEQRAFETPYSVSAVEREAIRAGGPMVNLSESMARVPGLIVANRSNYAQDLQINSRGFGARATFGVRGLRLYTDGIPATMPDGQGQVSHFDLAGAQRVEVLRGPFSALYGNSSGGVIALVSAPVDSRYGEVALDGGSFGLRQARLTAQAPFGDTPGRGLDLRLGASYFEIDGFRPHSSAERTLANLRAGWTGDADTVVVSLNYLDQPADDPLGLSREQFDADPYQTTSQAFTFDTRKQAQQEQLGAQWRHRFDNLGPLAESALTAYGGRRSVTQWQAIPVLTQNNPNPPPFTTRHPGGVIDFDRSYAGVDGRLVLRWALEDERSAKLVIGATAERSSEDRRGYENFIGDPLAPSAIGVTGRLRRDETNSTRSIDGYAQGEIEFVRNWVATLGVRSGTIRFKAEDRYIVGTNGDDSGEREFSYTNPVAALQWRAAPGLNLYLSAGRGFESPTFNELAYRPDGQAGFNADLQAQTSRQLELGAKWRNESLGLSLDAALFEARTDDEIGVATNAGGRSSFRNVGRTTRRGVEIGGAWAITREWRTAIALTWLEARYDDGFMTCLAAPCLVPNVPVAAGNRIAGTTPRVGYAEVAWRPLADTELAAEWRGQGATPVNDLNRDFAHGFATVALRASQGFDLGAGGRIEALARIDNLFDRVYAGSVIVNEANSRFFEPGAPRNYYLGLKWRLGF